MEKESLTHAFLFIDNIFKSFFDFNIIFSPSGDGKVILNKRYLENASIEIANKISFIKSQIDPKKSEELIVFDISELVTTLNSETFEQTNSDQILNLLNQIAQKYKLFHSFQKTL